VPKEIKVGSLAQLDRATAFKPLQKRLAKLGAFIEKRNL
jgi:hypothetical protein